MSVLTSATNAFCTDLGLLTVTATLLALAV